jgi:DNA invertase Pin-like site-specific DNA recombinase
MVVSAYCRVSTDSKDQLNGLENQKSYFEREIKAKGHTLYKVYYDKGLTGTKLSNRPAFEQMLIDAGIDVKKVFLDKHDKRVKRAHTIYEVSNRTPLFDEIWIKNTSRFARNTLSYEIIGKLRQKKVNIFFIEQNINSSDMTQDLLLKLMQIFDEQDSKDKSLKVRTGIAESAKKGHIRTCSNFFGYNYIQSENRLEIIPEEAKTVKTAYELYASGKGYRQIRNYLTEHNMLTRAGKPFVQTSIRRMLTNEKYAGYNNPLKIDHGKVFEKYTYPKVREHYDVLPTDRIPAIVSKELFDKCQKVLDSRIDIYSHRGQYKGDSKYCDLIYCGQCGAVYYSNVIKQRDGSSKKLYNCKTKKQHGIAACDSPNVYESQIDEYIEDLANHSLAITIQKEKERATNIIFNIIRLKLNQMNTDNDIQANKIHEKIENQQSTVESLYELYSRPKAPQIEKDRLMKRIVQEESQLEELQSQYADATKSNDQLKREIVKLYDLHTAICNMENNKSKYSIEETLDMIDKIIIKKTKTGFVIESPIKKAEEIDNLVEAYKKDTDFKPLSQDEFRAIIEKLKEFIAFV